GGGSQDTTGIVVDTLEASGKLTIAVQDYTEYNYFLNNTQPTFSLVFTSGTNTLTIQMTKTAFTAMPLDHSKKLLTVVGDYRAIANATDGGTGNAPVKFVLVNGRSTAY